MFWTGLLIQLRIIARFHLGIFSNISMYEHLGQGASLFLRV
jgi:hypothetical protein